MILLSRQSRFQARIFVEDVIKFLGNLIRAKRGVIYRRNTVGSNSPQIRSDNPYDFRELIGKDLANSNIFSYKNRVDRYNRRFKEGHRCFGYSTDAQVVNHTWASVGIAVPWEFGLNIRFGMKICYLWDCRTIESHKGRGLYPASIQRTYSNIVGNWSAHPAYICTEIKNIASRRGIEKAGFEIGSSYWIIALSKLRIVVLPSRWAIYVKRVGQCVTY